MLEEKSLPLARPVRSLFFAFLAAVHPLVPGNLYIHVINYFFLYWDH